jgi:hypothetical protein
MPGHRGGLDQGRRAQVHPLGQSPEHPYRQVHIPAEGTIGVGVAGSAAKVGAARGEVGPVRGILGRARTRRSRVDRDGGPGLRARTVGRGADHHPGNFVAQDQRRLQDGLPRRAMQPIMKVRSADPPVNHLHYSFIGCGPGQRDLIDPQVTGGVGHQRRTRGRQRVRIGCQVCIQGHQTTTVIPPSIKMVCPFTKSDPSEASHTTGPARSSTVPQRWAGVLPRIQELNSSSSTRFWVISVWM